jgi:hypothetical protein
MRYVRGSALAAIVLSLCLLLAGCPGEGGDDGGCPGCGPPPTQNPFPGGQSPVPAIPTPSCNLITNPHNCAGEPTGGNGLGTGGG